MKYLFVLLTMASITAFAQQKKPQQKNKTKVNLANKVDPVCQMKVDETVKDTLHYKHKVYGFCSAHCKSTVKKNPSKYIK